MAPTTWRGMLAPLDTSTGDGRRFLSSGVTNRPLPLPLKWQRSDQPGHDDSVTIGSLEQITYGSVADAIAAGLTDQQRCDTAGLDPTALGVWGTGQLFAPDPQVMPRLAEDIAEATLLLSQGVIGPSVDAGACEAALVEVGSDKPLTDSDLEALFWSDSTDEGETPELEMLFTEYQIAAATLVSIPAFAQCRPFELMTPDMALTAAVRSEGWADMPLAAQDAPWDEVAANKRLAEACGIGSDTPDWGKYATAFLYVDDSADKETKGAYEFQIVDLDGDTWEIYPRAVFAVADVLQGGRGGTTIPQADQDSMKDVVGGIYERMEKEFDDPAIEAPWEHTDAALIAALSAPAVASYDPAWFVDPQLSTITPLTVTDDGRVFGHVASHDVCHVGIRDTCTTAPVSDRDYEPFHRYTVEVDGGGMVQVGRITTGRGEFACTCPSCRGSNDDHACGRLTAGATIAHHDQLATVAWVRAGEDTANNAIWVAGVLSSCAAPADVEVLSRGKVSGDWRSLGGQLELVEVLSLSREKPGFPLPRVRSDAGQPMALTAAGTIRSAEHAVAISASLVGEIDYVRLGAEIARSLSGIVPPVEVEVITTGAGETVGSVTVEVAPEVVAGLTADALDEVILALFDEAEQAVVAGLSAVADGLRADVERMN